MADSLPLPVRQRGQARTVLVVLLHGHDCETFAIELMRAWEPLVPAAVIATLSGAGGVGAALEQIACKLEQHGSDMAHLVLAGIGDGMETALQLAFGRDALDCAGALACGDRLPPMTVLAGPFARPRAKLRLILTAEDPLACSAALGVLLHCFRAISVDAQGDVIARQEHPSPGVDGGPGASAPPGASTPMIRLGGAYLSELVAVALSAPSINQPSTRGPGGMPVRQYRCTTAADAGNEPVVPPAPPVAAA